MTVCMCGPVHLKQEVAELLPTSMYVHVAMPQDYTDYPTAV